MDKIISARVDESVAQTIDLLSRDLGKSKKSIIEEAIRDYTQKDRENRMVDVYQLTHGSWKRGESADKTVEKSRTAFESSMKRHSR